MIQGKKAQIMETMKVVGAILIVLLIISILSIIAFLVINSLTPALTLTDTQTTTVSAEQNGTNVTTAGIYLTACQVYSDSGGNIASLTARNITLVINSANYTTSACKLTPTASSEYANRLWNITYTFTYDNSATQGVNIGNNISTGIAGFFTQIPTIFLILGIVVLIASIVLIIVIVRKVAGSGVEVL